MNGLDEYFKIDFQNKMSQPKSVFKGQNYRITVLTERLLRLEYSKDGYFLDNLTEQVINRNFDVPLFTVNETPRFLDISTKYFSLKYTKEKSFDSLSVNLINTGKTWDYKNREVRNFKTTGNGFVNYQLDYAKGLYSVDGFAALDDSKSLIFSEDGSLTSDTTERIDIYLFMYRRDFGLCLRDYFLLTGYPTLLPRYALGIWWNKSDVYNFNQIQNLIKEFNKNKIPLSVILLDEYWHLKDYNNIERYKTGFTFNRLLFPDPTYFINFLHEHKIKLGLKLDPSEGIMPHEDAYDSLAKSINLFDRSTIPFNVFDKNIVNNYFNLVIEPLKEKGVDFFFLNYSKALNTISNRAYIHYHFMNSKRDVNKRGFIFANNEKVATHRYTALYSGKTKVAFETLNSLPAYNSLGANKGIAWWSHDIGGYEDGMEQRELYMRYVQLGCFSPIFRFASKPGRYYKREPWLWDIKTLSIVRDYTQLRHRLIPYLYTENYKYHKTGLPLIQPLYYSRPEVYDEPYYKNEYYFGSELLISPITTQKDNLMNRTIERIYLPEGTWYDFKTGKKFLGNKRYVTFYKDEDYPFFAKSGTIIPMQELNDELNNTDIPDSLEIHIFPGKSNIYKLYEDDGITANYKNGKYTITAIDYNYLQNNYTVIIHPIEGDTTILPTYRDYKIRFRNTRKADEVIVYLDNEQIDKTTYVDDTDFVVNVTHVKTTSQLTINCKGKDIEIDAVRLINEDIDSIITDLQIKTSLKEQLANIIFSDLTISKKRIAIRKLKKYGLEDTFIRMFMRLMEYISEF